MIIQARYRPYRKLIVLVQEVSKMPVTCCVVGCSSRGNRDNVSFYKIPNTTDTRGREDALKIRRRQAWLSAIQRSDLVGTKLKNAKVCSRHFIKGKPSAEDCDTNPDWAPSKFLRPIKSPKNISSKQSPSEVKRKRFCRVQNRQRRNLLAQFNKEKQSFLGEGETSQNTVEVDDSDIIVNKEQAELVEVDLIQKLREEERNRIIEIKNLRTKISNLELNFDTFKNNDKQTLFYTGIPTFFVFNEIVKLLEPELISNPPTALSSFQQILLTFMKLRLNLLFTDLGYRFNIDRTTASRYFFKCINLMFYKCKRFVRWPERTEIRSKMPESFKKCFGNKVAVIVDCFEIFVERASSMEAKIQTWSNYKHNYTIKYLIGITPQGFISYISKGYGGRTSDTYLTENCGILNNLLPGDIILADRGFRIEDAVRIYQAEVLTPTFLKGKKQLAPIEVEETRNLVNVRIHVERVIGSLRQKYTILSGKLPITILNKYSNESVTTIDKIVTVCCALTNLCPGIVPLTD